jgi:formylglycine-generating enzyme required for sulfatase activity
VSAAAVETAQEAWAEYLGRPVEEEDEIAPGVRMTFVLVPPGKFLMGSPADEKNRGDDETVHEVTLTEPFDLGQTEVTQAQYQALTGKSPSLFKGADRPVEMVSWEEARDYAARLTKRRGDHRTYRLPTEAEWEYACRGGRPSSQPFGVGDGRTLSSRDANLSGQEATCRVGSYPANALDLCDMHGNVQEWCADWYGSYPAENERNPTGPGGGASRVYRGGCWGSNAWNYRAAARDKFRPGDRNGCLGFRLARSPSGMGK